MKIKLFISVNFMLLIFTIFSCKKLVEVDGPTTSLNSDNVYESDVTAASVLTGIYTNLSLAGIQEGKLTSISCLTGLSSDELTFYDGANNQNLNAYYTNTLNSRAIGFEFWQNIYPVLYIVNSALEGVSNSNSLTPAVKQQLLGEAKFMRALCFFYLVNLYGDVPLVMSTDYKANSLIKRAAQSEVWNQIILDLKDAQSLLDIKYLGGSLLKGTNERVRPNKSAATALLARTYLYTKNWKESEVEATKVIDNSDYELVNLNSVFLKNSREAIWQLQPVIKGTNSQEGNTFILTDPIELTYKPALNTRLIDSFEEGDQRKSDWVNSVVFDGVTYFFPYKYKLISTFIPTDPVVECSTVLRLAEQYLIRAEARIQQGRIADGIVDLNKLRERATNKSAPINQQLAPLSENVSKDSALLLIEHERQVELFTEWGDRWLNLKRTNRINSIMTLEVPKKIGGGVWVNYQQWFPISSEELNSNPKLSQNEGY
ncbi:RagB/SusD family nutrient uptake outer membrane protein [Pedobacter panaciterrae]|uniref:RagB/SusD family nutrient uptake outer membrane protein n=1 Tax=Pedobacter panaciterrae TaxID=363849 RepID=UPI00155DD9CD|nr:RagB/SusD family nutrient uptake outer membrane protein [Pedobacter panaciterrae]NQX54432.1 RagB/SusD family nutrient uptake outer membrane protein [Pedobacter panaciterrae]